MFIGIPCHIQIKFLNFILSDVKKIEEFMTS